MKYLLILIVVLIIFLFFTSKKEYFTEKGKEELKVIQDRLVLVGKTKDIGDAESEDDIPFEQMP